VIHNGGRKQEQRQIVDQSVRAYQETGYNRHAERDVEVLTPAGHVDESSEYCEVENRRERTREPRNK